MGLCVEKQMHSNKTRFGAHLVVIASSLVLTVRDKRLNTSRRIA